MKRNKKNVMLETAPPLSQALSNRCVRLWAGDIVVCAVQSVSVAGFQSFSHFQDKYSPSEGFLVILIFLPLFFMICEYSC